nr:plastocyanin [Rhizobium sp. Q54]
MEYYRKLFLAAIMGLAIAATPAFSQDADDDDDDDGSAPAAAATEQVTRASKDVPELVLGSADDSFTVNQKDFELIAGQGYRWKITSAAGLEYKFHTDLFRNVWMNQIVINDLEVHMNGAPAWLEFDAEGTMQVQFTTIRPGTYTWSVPDLVDRGMQGTITIK